MAQPGWSRGQQTTVTQVLDNAIAMRGLDFDFLDFSGDKYSLGYIKAHSEALARGLAAAGAAPGECVASVLDNSIEQILLLFACARIGAIHVPLNTAYKGEFLRHQLADCAAPVIVAEKEYLARVIEVEDGLPDARTLLHKGDLPAAKPAKLKAQALDDTYLDGSSEFADASKPADLGMLIYTAGTTGPSKGCMVSQNYVCNMARQLATYLYYTEDDVVWTPLPGFHMNMYTATLLSSLMVGARAAIFPRFSVSNFWPEIERTGATVTQILSSMIALLAQAPDNEAMKRCYGQLRVAAGAPFPQPLLDIWNKRFAPKMGGAIGFGLTECALVTSCYVDEERPPESSGRVDPDFDVRIVDEDDNEVPPGTPGEIIVRPVKPHVMFEGYWRRPADTLKVMRNQWFHTGDVGMFDA